MKKTYAWFFILPIAIVSIPFVVLSLLSIDYSCNNSEIIFHKNEQHTVKVYEYTGGATVPDYIKLIIDKKLVYYDKCSIPIVIDSFEIDSDSLELCYYAPDFRKVKVSLDSVGCETCF